MIPLIAVFLSCIKILLIPSYKSTDFEVHRNWLAITSSLPLDQWYTDSTSQWTLDYPPLFAWFEYILSKVAVYFDPKMLQVSNLNYDSQDTILFQRLSVIVTDLVFAYGCRVCVTEVQRQMPHKNQSNFLWLFAVIFGNAGLLLVDHIHFQYNGFLSGIFMISIARMLQGKELQSAFWFSVLLNLKHIYLYMAPAYFVYLLRSFCLKSNKKSGRVSGVHLSNLVKLGLVVISVFSVSFGPFIWIGQGKQVLSRLFPFKRGLSHAYWAPNFWAVYNTADKVLSVAAKQLGWSVAGSGAHMTGGLVADVTHQVLPSIYPLHTFILTLVAIMPCLVQLWLRPHDRWLFVRCAVICAFSSFLFGWHVHEKAILVVLLPMSLFILLDREDGRTFLLLSVTGHYSLFPLIFTSKETILKISCLLLHANVTSHLLTEFWGQSSRRKVKLFDYPSLPLLNCFETIFVFCLYPIYSFCELFPLFNTSFHFLPLLLTSFFCSIGVIYSWWRFYTPIFVSSNKNKLKIT